MNFLKRFWPWKRIAELEVKLSRMATELDTLQKVHVAQMQDEVAAHSETKQHLKAAREAQTFTQNSLKKVVTIMAMKHGIK